MRRKSVIYSILGCLGLILILWMGRNYFLSAAGSFLVVRDELKPADVIIALGGDVERVTQAAILYKRGYAKFIIMTAPVATAEWMEQTAVKAGVPADRILLEPGAEHTYQHPLFVRPILAAHGFTSAIVVSSPYHMRRVAMLFDRVFHKTGIKLIYYPVANSWFDVEHWWQSKEGREIVFWEYAKIAVNFWGTGVNDFACVMIKKFKKG